MSTFNEFDADYEGVLKLDVVAPILNNPVTQQAVDIDQLIGSVVPVEDLDVIQNAPVQRDFNLPLGEDLKELTLPIGVRAFTTEAISNLNALTMNLKEVGVNVQYFMRDLKARYAQWLDANAALIKLDMSQMDLARAFFTEVIRGSIAADFGRNMFWNKPTSHYLFLKGYRGLWASYFEADPTLSRAPIVLDEDPYSLTNDAVLKVFRDMYNAQVPDMKARPNTDKVFWCDGDYWSKLYDAITDLGGTGAGEFYIRRIQDAEERLFLRGVEIKAFNSWQDEIFAYDPAGAGKGKYERRIMLTLKSNFAAAINSVTDSAFILEAFYDNVSQSNIFRSGYYADTGLKRIKYVVVALSSQNTPFILTAVPTAVDEVKKWPYKSIDQATLFGGVNNATTANVAVAVGDTVTVRGNNFTGITAVAVGTQAQSVFTVVDDNTLTFVAEGAETAEALTLTNAQGSTVAEQTMTIA